MRTVVQKSMWVIVGLISISLVSGCTPWKKKYAGLNVEHQNLKGLYENEAAQKAQLAQQVSEDQRLIEELQNQIAQGKQTAGKATGFGDEYQVAFDAEAGTITVTLPNMILFDSGKADLKKNKALSKIIAVIEEKYAGRQIDIVGHTDSDPIRKSKWRDNLELSVQRSSAVARYFIAHGVPDKQVCAVGYGSTRPVAPNDTAAGKARNRRVEIVVHIKS